MATGLATRCSACGTVFRVVPDQLRVSEGWVRCGRCSQVFNALESLVDLESGLPRPTPGVGPGLAPPVQEAPDDDFDFAHPAAKPGAPPLPPPSLASSPPSSPAPFSTSPSPRPGPSMAAPAKPLHRVPHDTAPTDADHVSTLVEPDDQAAEAPSGSAAPSFVRSAERAARWRQPRMRVLLSLLALAGLLGLGAQVAHEYRDLLAARLPQTRPWLEQACAPLGCAVGAARAIESLAVDSSGLVRVEKSNLYKLQVTLRNRAGIDLAVPALDVTLSDTQGRLIARKVLQLAELGVSQATIAAGRELSVQATLQAAAGSEAAAQPIAGYTIELFYP